MNSLIKYLLNFRLLFIILGGIFFYLLSAILDPIFIPTLDMPGTWCNKWIERRISYRNQEECVEFTNKLDELKYRHNQRMENRRTHKMFGLFLAASALTFLLMVLKPVYFFGEGVPLENITGVIAVAVYYGVIIGFIMPTIYQLLLPPPLGWLPREFSDIQQARIDFIIKSINESAK
ncbi:MAG: hypothetical protein JSW26_15575 [Desulfobacterales bacterium]|nr:MAG: hypothetical protein JSW26_15575 [Desulfobacterales bacterium]